MTLFRAHLKVLEVGLADPPQIARQKESQRGFPGRRLRQAVLAQQVSALPCDLQPHPGVVATVGELFGRGEALLGALCVARGAEIADLLEREFGLDSTTATGSRETSAPQVRLQRSLEALLEVSLASARVLDSSKLCALALRELVRILGAERAFLFLLDEKNELRFETGLDQEGQTPAEPRDYATTVVQRAASTARTVLLSGTEEGRLLGSGKRGATSSAARKTSSGLGHGVCVMIFDIDFFKKFNDTYGHAVGDLVLSTAAERLKRCLRSIDVLGRVGGEEFAVLLVGTGLEAGGATAERLRASMADEPFETSHGPLKVTISIGITVRQTREELEVAMERADQALYRAKAGGRNRVEAG